MSYLKRYKLTTQNMTTFNDFQIPATGWYYPANLKDDFPRPCTNTVLHHYPHPLLAVLLNPVHADIDNPRLFEIQVKKELGSDGLKGWSREQRIVKELKLPEVTLVNRVAFGIYCALYKYAGNAEFNSWAQAWLNNENRLEDTAHIIAHAYPMFSGAAQAARAAIALRCSGNAANIDKNVVYNSAGAAALAAEVLIHSSVYTTKQITAMILKSANKALLIS